MIKFAVFGDSIAAAQGVSIDKGWPALMAQNVNSDKKFDVQVFAINGNTTRQALERMPHDIQGKNFDMIAIQFGLNDCNHWVSDNGLPRVSRAAFEANMAEIADRARASGIKKIFVITNHPTLKTITAPTIKKTYEELNASYSESIRSLTTLGDVRVIDMQAFFKSLTADGTYALEDLLLPDGLHLSHLGHSIYSEEILKAVLKHEPDK